MKYYLYILQSDKDHGFYIGSTDDIERRLREHNTGFSKSTKPRRPFKIVHAKKFQSKSEAVKYEYFLKSPKGYQEKLRIINNFRP